MVFRAEPRPRATGRYLEPEICRPGRDWWGLETLGVNAAWPIASSSWPHLEFLNLKTVGLGIVRSSASMPETSLLINEDRGFQNAS